MSDPTVVVDLVHAELSLSELLDIARQGFALFGHGLDALKQAYCALPFVRSC